MKPIICRIGRDPPGLVLGGVDTEVGFGHWEGHWELRCALDITMRTGHRALWLYFFPGHGGVLSYPDYLKTPPLVGINTLQKVTLASDKILLEKYESLDVFADKRRQN